MARQNLSAAELSEKLSEVNSWAETNGKLFKRFNFKNFAEALDFVNKIGAIAEKQDHHPDIKIGWGYAEFEITTHDAGGLTDNDFKLARAIENIKC